jgi:hypothetical protein
MSIKAIASNGAAEAFWTSAHDLLLACAKVNDKGRYHAQPAAVMSHAQRAPLPHPARLS